RASIVACPRPIPGPYHTHLIVATIKSRTQAPEQGRQIERAEAVVVDPALVAVEEGAEIRHAVFEHGDAIDAHAPGEPLIDIGIKPGIADDIGMDHAAAEDFKPVAALADLHLGAGAVALHVDFHTRLGEGEE